MLSRHIAIIGFRGAGKTTLAKKLSLEKKIPFHSTDDLITKQLKSNFNQTVDQYIESSSWEDFRNLESKILENLCHQAPCIIDTGGGIVEKSDNRLLLKKHCLNIFIDTPWHTIEKNLNNSHLRYPLPLGNKIHYKKRLPHYLSLADIHQPYGNSFDGLLDSLDRHLSAST